MDFDEASARESAEQDWKIDLEREQQERKQANKLGGDLEQVDEEENRESDEEVESSEEFDEEDERFMNALLHSVPLL